MPPAGPGASARENSLMFQVRRISSDEWEDLREIRLAALKDSPDWFWATYEEEVGKPATWWRDFIDAGAWFVAFENGRAVGVAAAMRDPQLADSDRQLISMWVDPDARKRGIGTQLIEAVKVWAREDGARELQLEVTDANEVAARVYERSGFRLTGRATAHPRDLRLTEHEMRLRL
jgi:RimJ/RimL family protein N-acetyltransferase